MKQYFVANWKQNLTPEEAQKWLANFNTRGDEEKEIIIAPPAAFLSSLANKGLPLAIQDISAFSGGEHTGRIGATQVSDWAQYALLGHSELREEAGETNRQVVLKVKHCVEARLRPIVCVDLPYLESQINLIKQEVLEFDGFIFAYEPLSAIGSGKAVDPRYANEIAFKIKSLTSKSTAVLYGGSVDAQNVKSFLDEEHVDGLLVGKASLDPVEFAKICQ